MDGLPDAVPALARVDRLDGDTTLVSVLGEVDLASAPGIERAVLGAVEAAAGCRVVVELNGVELLGARGITVLLTARDRACRSGGELLLVAGCAQPAARTLRCLPGIALPTYPSLAAALAAPV